MKYSKEHEEKWIAQLQSLIRDVSDNDVYFTTVYHAPHGDIIWFTLASFTNEINASIINQLTDCDARFITLYTKHDKVILDGYIHTRTLEKNARYYSSQTEGKQQ